MAKTVRLSETVAEINVCFVLCPGGVWEGGVQVNKHC